MNVQGRFSLALLWLLALSQLWLIYRVEFSGSNDGVGLTVDAVTAAYQPSSTYTDNAQMLSLLQKIERRLSVQSASSKDETQHEKEQVISSNSSAPIAPYDQVSIAKADQQLTTILPYGRISQQRIMDFHAELQRLPAAQRVELATALSRAINEGRIEPVPGMP